MGFNLVNAVLAQATPSKVSKIAESTGESPTKTGAAMSTGAVAIVAGIVRRASTRAGAASLLSTLQSSGAGSSATNLASGLLGDQTEQDHLTETVARSSGVNRSTASSILSSLLPATAGVLGREVASRKLDAGGLSELMASQKTNVINHPQLPGGLGKWFGRGAASETRGIEPESKDVGVYDASALHRVAQVRPPKRGWLPVLAALVIGGLLLALLIGRRPTVPKLSMPSAPELPKVEAPLVRVPEVPAAPTLVTPAAPEAPEAQPAEQGPNVPGQTTLTGAEIAKPSTDEIGAHFGEGGPLPERFVLPGLSFEFASADMTDGGEDSLDRVAALLKDHPSARVRIEGHTDSVGDPTVNTPLSFQRAAAVRRALIDRGVDGSRLEVTGRRDLDAIASNATTDGRAQNRRVDIVILSR